jgi:hypothetical protein
MLKEKDIRRLLVRSRDVAPFWIINGLQKGAGDMGRLKQKDYFRAFPHLHQFAFSTSNNGAEHLPGAGAGMSGASGIRLPGATEAIHLGPSWLSPSSGNKRLK